MYTRTRNSFHRQNAAEIAKSQHIIFLAVSISKNSALLQAGFQLQSARQIATPSHMNCTVLSNRRTSSWCIVGNGEVCRFCSPKSNRGSFTAFRMTARNRRLEPHFAPFCESCFPSIAGRTLRQSGGLQAIIACSGIFCGPGESLRPATRCAHREFRLGITMR